MESESREPDLSVEETLFKEPYRFEFFQAVRLLEWLYPERAPVGRTDKAGVPPLPSKEAARFRTRVSLLFPPSQIHELSREEKPAVEGEDGAPPQVEVAFMGLTGPLGVLPNVYTEWLIERLRRKDHALRDFLDMFNHRFISFFHRAWEKYRFPTAYERRRREEQNEGRARQPGEKEPEPGDDQFTAALFALINLGTPGLRRRLSFHDEAMLRYGGLIAQRPHSASAIAAILGDYFGVPARVAQFTGQWLQLEPESYSRLGQANTRLSARGHHVDRAAIGTRVWDSQSKFRIVLGPMGYHQFADFLPVGTAFNPVMDWVRFLAGAEFDFDVQLTLRAKEVPCTVLTTRARRRPRLGWTTWLRTPEKEFTEDDSQVVLRNRN